MSAPLSVASRTADTGRPGRGRDRFAQVLLVALLAVLLAAGWLLWDNRRLDVTAYEVGPPPNGTEASAAATGVRIAQVSDLHAASFGTFTQRLVEAVEAAEPDLIALTGDLIDVRTADLSEVLAVVERLQAVAPAYFVLGNHEADSTLQDELLAGLEERGVVVLRDEAAQVRVAGTEFTLIGIDDPRVRAVRGLEPRDPAEVLPGLVPSEAGTTVLLAHRPELLDRYAGQGIDLVLSGHAHGGQVRVPGLGGLFAPHQGWLPDLSEGVHERGGTTMVISRGLGNSIAAVRVNDPRELVIVDLRVVP